MREAILASAGSPVAFDVFSQDEAPYDYLSSDPEIKLKSSQQRTEKHRSSQYFTLCE